MDVLQQFAAGSLYGLINPKNLREFRRSNQRVASRIPIVRIHPSRLHGQVQAFFAFPSGLLGPLTLGHVANDDGKQLPALGICLSDGGFDGNRWRERPISHLVHPQHSR
jgi:hypothetical protein